MSAIPVTETAYGTVHTVVSESGDKDQAIVSLSDPSVEETVRQYFEDLPVMVRIARCESTFRHFLEDGTVLRGKVDKRDVGVMQINTGFHGETAKELGFDLMTIEGNMAYARYLYESKGTAPWNASSKCWNKTLAQL